MSNNYKLENIEAIFLIIIITTSKIIANITFYCVNTVGSGSITNFIYIGIIDFLFMIFIIRLQKKFKNFDIIDISEFLGGKILKFAIGIISILVLYLSAYVTLKDFSSTLQKVYFFNFSIIYIIMFFIIAALIANLIGFKSISRCNILIVPFIILAIISTFVSILNKINIRNMTPIFGDSFYKTFASGLSNIYIMCYLTYILFLKPLLKNESSFKKISIISYLISWFSTLLVIIAITLIFNAIPNSKPSNNVFFIVRLVSFGNFIERIDSLFILLCVISIFSYLSFVIFLINRIINKIFIIADEKMLSFSTCSILFALVLIPIDISNLYFLESTVYKFVIIFYNFFLCISILIMANSKNKPRIEKI